MKIEKFRPLRQPLTPEQQDQKLKDVAKLYEKQFLREMLKQMRSTVSEGGFIQANQAEKIFREQLDQQYVDKWGDKGGIGLSDMIYKQLIDRYGEALGIKPRELRGMGPLKLNSRSDFHGKISDQGNKVAVRFEKAVQQSLNEVALQEQGSKSVEIQIPWEGRLLSHKRLTEDEHLLNLTHDNGLSSQMVFRGQILPGLEGRSLAQGESIGVLSPEAKSFFWSINKPDTENKTVSE